MDNRSITPHTSEAASVVECHNICFHCIPELVWDTVFDALKDDPGALTNCFLASATWRRMLAKKKIDFMSPVILCLVARRHLFTQWELKSLRLVSRLWKEAVDGLNRDMPELIPDYYRTPSYRTWFTKPKFVFSGSTHFSMGMERGYPSLDEQQFSEETLAIMNDLKTRSENPFPSREIHLELYPGIIMLNEDFSYYKYDHKFGILWQIYPSRFRNCLKFDKSFHEMLDSVGNHVWHFVHAAYSDHYDYLRNIIKMLKLLPNLRSFTLKNLSLAGNTCWNGPAPLLPNLVALTIPKVECGSCIPNFFLRTYGHQLETLECFYYQSDHLVDTLPNLKTLKLRTSGVCLHKIGSRFVAPRLQRIFVDLGLVASDVNPLWHLIVGLQTFSSSLELLFVDRMLANLSEELCVNLEAEKDPVSKFPRLKSFQINLSFESSPNLEWGLGKFPALEEIRFYDDDNRKGEFDIGRLFGAVPTLQKVYGHGHGLGRNKFERVRQCYKINQRKEEID